MDSKKKSLPPGLIFGHHHVITDDMRKRLLSVKPIRHVYVVPDMHIGARNSPSPIELLERLKQRNLGRNLVIFFSRGDSLEDFETSKKADQ